MAALMELYFFLATVVLVSLSGVMAPGPLFAAAIAEGRKSSFSGLSVSAGHAALEIPIILALVVFGVAIATQSIKMVIGVLGGSFLLYMAVMELRNFGQKVEAKKRRSFFSGIAMTGVNPYFLIWWLTVGFHLVNQAILFGVLGIVLFIIVHEMCDVAFLGFVSATSNKTASMWGDRSYKILSGISITIFVVFGIYFLATGVYSLSQLMNIS
ncbi:MAG: LysE family transporter [Archaeoglobaceae archaeon]